MLGLFNPEDAEVCSFELSMHFYQTMWCYVSACCLHPVGFLLDLFFDPEDGGSNL
jgi:hypothetical protein